MIELLDEKGLSEIEVREGETTIRVARALTAAAPVAATPASSSEPSSPTGSTTPTKGHVLRAPMVGMFYRAPSPGSPAFAEVGDRVKEGQVLCIIESMKMMNQVKCDRSGVLEAVLADNETPVEFDQPLFTIT